MNSFHPFRSANPGLLSFAVGFALLVHTSSGQISSDLINDQIASHFNQVFSEESSVYAPEKSSWVPGNDKDHRVLGSQWMSEVSLTQVMETRIADHTDHKVDVQYAEFGISGTVPLRPRHKLSFAFNTTLYRIDETTGGKEDLLYIDKAEKIDAGFMYRLSVNPRWELLGGGGLTFTDADHPEFGGKTTLIGYGGAAYTFNPNLTMAFAFAASSRDIHGKQPFPLFVLDWRINDRNRMMIGDGFFYRYALNKDWKDVLSFEINPTVITLHTGDRVVDGHHLVNPSLVVQDVAVALSYSHTFDNGLVFSSRFGVAHVGQHSFDDGDDEYGRVEFEPNPGISIGLKYHF